MTSIDVTFTVPPGDDWAIFVSPEQGHGPVVHAVDVPPHAAGELPFSIAIWPDGPPGAAIPNNLGPGWFGR